VYLDSESLWEPQNLYVTSSANPKKPTDMQIDKTKNAIILPQKATVWQPFPVSFALLPN